MPGTLVPINPMVPSLVWLIGIEQLHPI